MIYLGITLLGLISIFNLPQELFPPVTFPQLTVVTTYPNAAPEEVENLVTKTIEEAVSTVKGLKTLKSYSREGVSLVIGEFSWGMNIDMASLGMREKIDLVVMGIKRKRAFAQAILGSTSEAVLNHAPCSVLLVPQP